MSFFERLVENFFKKFQEKIPVFSVLFLFSFFGFAVVSIFTALDTAHSATPPSIITYQGKLLDGGSAVDATTTMEFLIYDDPTGGTLLYTAGGTIGVPDTIEVPVDNGIFSVNFGAAGTNNVTSSIFANSNALYLEVSVEGQTLSPRKRLNAAPFALNSSYLMGYGAATASTTVFIPLSDANGNFAFTGDPQSSSLNGGVMLLAPSAAGANETLFAVAVGTTEKFRLDAEGDSWFSGNLTATGTATSSFTNVLVNDGITLGGEKRTSWPAGGGDVAAADDNTFTGSNTFSSTTVFVGKIGEPSLFASYTSSTILSGASGVAVQGDHAFVVSFLDDTLTSIDVSSSTNPVYANSLAVGSRPSAIAIQGNYAYITETFNSAVKVVDISNPNALSVVATLQDFGNLSGPRGIALSGNYAYVADASGDQLTVLDISDPKAPLVVGTLDHGTDGALLQEPWSVAISGKYAYVVSETSDSLEVVDISNPRSPRHVSSVADGGGVAPYLDGAHSISIQGSYAYVGNVEGVIQGVQILDISDPTNVVTLGNLSGLGVVVSLASAGDYLYAYASTEFDVIDIHDKENPTLFATTTAGSGNDLIGGNGIALDGNKAYLAEYTGDKFRVYDITGVKITNVETGNATVSNLTVRNDVSFGSQVSVRGGLSVGSSGLLLSGDFAMSSPTSSLAATNTMHFSHTALFETFASTTDDHAFIFNTKNSLTVATTTYLLSLRNNGTPTFSVSSNGNVNTTGTYYGYGATIGTPGAPGDLAESVDIAIDDEVEPGDVVVVDPHATDSYRRSTSAYSSQVSGVISTLPTIVIGNGKTEHTAVMAIVGRVPIKVSAENGPIVRGDLLITATSTGYAMRYDAEKDIGGRVSGIIGVALESLPEGTGKIMGLVRTGWVSGEYRQTFSEIRSELSRLALAQTNLQSTSVVTISQNDDGTIRPIESDLNLNGFSLLAVKSIRGLNEKWIIDEQGRFTSKVDTSAGSKTLFSLQSGESQYVFSGSGTLENGHVRVDFDDAVLDIVDTEKPMSINLTLTARAKGIYVSDRDETGFDVEEMDGGSSNATFDWLVFATRKDLESGDQEQEDFVQENSSTEERSGEELPEGDTSTSTPEGVEENISESGEETSSSTPIEETSTENSPEESVPEVAPEAPVESSSNDAPSVEAPTPAPEEPSSGV